MSYYVKLEIYWDGPGFDLFDKVACRKVFARAEGYIRDKTSDQYPAADWMDEFRSAFAGKGGDIKGLEKNWASSLLRHVSKGFPGVIFGTRGVGEELDDVWVFWYRDGRRIKSPAKDED